MDIRKMDWFRKRKIALRLLLVFLLELCSPLVDTLVYARVLGPPNLNTPSPTHVVTESDGRKSSIRYETMQYNIEVIDKDGNKQIIEIPAKAKTNYTDEGAVTTHTLDLDLFAYYMNEVHEADWSQFIGEDGQYHFDSIDSIAVKKDGVQQGDWVVGPEGMQSCGVDWSNTTDRGLASTDPNLNPALTSFAIPEDLIPISPPPTNTPVPTATGTPIPTKTPITNTPIPTNAPTDIPIQEELPPPPTPTSTPVPTATPKPSATPKPTSPPPTPEPKTYTYDNIYEYHKYYSSTNGHSISDITVNGMIADDLSANAGTLADSIAAVGTRTAYSVGTDSSGNEWYYIGKSEQVSDGYGGTTTKYYAYSVHPKTYGGHSVDSSSVRHIYTLVFPEKIGSYEVKSIGGSGAYYYGERSSPVTGTVSSNLGTIMGEYSWKSGANTLEFSYLLGAVGSGTIKSKGFGITYQYNYDTYIYNNTYSTNYYVYNTTLSGITIPSTCETIEDYAFHNCQALIDIKGGENLKTIGTHAFSVAEVPELKRSFKYEPNYWAYNYYTSEIIYSYDDSYSMQYAGEFPETMKRFQEYVTINDCMEFPDPEKTSCFSKLVTIGESAFEGRYHLDFVKLSATVETIHKNAFKGCKLDRITVPNEKTSVKGNYDTLGTKGPDVNFLTEIVTPSESPAYPRMYGETYDDYYRVFQDAYIYYHPNGGTPDTVYSELAEIEYKEASFGDTYFDLGNSCILWLGDDGCVYYACVDDNNVLKGNIVAALRGFRFVSMEKRPDLGGYYEAITADGKYCYISATTVSVQGQRYESQYQGPQRGWQDVLVNYHRYYEPSVSYIFAPGYVRCTEIANITFPASNGYPLHIRAGYGVANGIKAVSEDGRFHYYYNGSWVSEPAWPSGVTVVQAVENSATVTQFGFLYDQYATNQASEAGYPCSYFEYATVDTHATILCSDGSVYSKIGVDGAWTKMEGTYIGISKGNCAAFSHGTGSYSSYATYRDYGYLNQDYLYENLNASKYRRYQITYQGVYNSETRKTTYTLYVDRSRYTDVDVSGVEFAAPPLNVASTFYSSSVMAFAAGAVRMLPNVLAQANVAGESRSDSDGGYAAVKYVQLMQDASTKEMFFRSHYDSSSGYMNGYQDFPAGTGTFLAARFETDYNDTSNTTISKRFVYYFGSDGSLYCTYGEDYETSTVKVSDFNYVKYYMLSPNFAPMGEAGWKYTSSQSTSSSAGSNTTSTYAKGDYINLICLDADGYLWSGVLGYGSATFTKMSDKVFTDILYKEIITEREKISEGNSWAADYQDNIYGRLYAIDTNKDVYKCDQLIKTVACDEEYGENNENINGSWVTIFTWHSTHTSTTYYAYDTLSLEYMDYAYDVEKFLSYPIILMEGSRPGLLTTTDAVTDIYCGVDIIFRVAGNNWFWPPSGKEFAGYWNTSADGTGTKRMVGDKIVTTSYSSNWKDSAEDMHLYAQWQDAVPLVNQTKEVHYDGNGAYGDISPNPQIIPAGTNYYTVAYNKNPGFTKEGYLFKNWNTKADGTGTTYNQGSTAAAVGPYTVLYAQWTPIKYTVKFAFDEIRLLPANFYYSAEVLYNGSVGMPPEPQQKKAIVDYDINTNIAMSTANLAKWIDTLPLASKFTHSVQKFQGWDLYYYNTNVNKYVGGYYRFPAYTEVKQLCDEDGDVAYMFPAWGGLDAYVCLPEVSCPGYDFIGWMNDRTIETSTDSVWYIPENGGGLYLPTGNQTLYAWWEPCQYEITLVQTMDGRNPDIAGDATVTMTFDQVCPDVTAPQIERYVFVGYNTKPDGTGEWYYGEADRDTHITTSGGKTWTVYDGSVTTLYAQWRPDKAIKYVPNYTWTPENALANDVYSIDSILGVTDNTVFVITDEPTFPLVPNYFTRRGYTFASWNLAPNGTGLSFADKAVINTNSAWLSGIIPMYAQWTANKYNLLYDLKGNKPNASTETEIEIMPATAVYDTAFTVSNPTKRGYTFLGWDIGGMSNCTHYYGGNTTNLTSLTGVKETTFKNLQHNAGSTVSFVAKWKPNTYEVTLHDRGATSTGHTGKVTMTFDEHCPSIVVPEKVGFTYGDYTGYTFQGYFTGIGGTGRKYYNADGSSAKTWTETDVYDLYAHWTQDTVVLPEEDVHVTPTPPPPENNEGNIGRTDLKALLYADDYNPATGALTDMQPYLTYNTPGSIGLIPGTELLSFRARMGSWMLNYKFRKNSGTDMVKMIVTVPYRTQYEDKATGKLIQSELLTAVKEIMVPKTWSYWEVMESGMYYPDKVTVTNPVLKDQTITVDVDRTGTNAVIAPGYSAKKYGEYKNHVKWSEYDVSGTTPVLRIDLTEVQYIISNTPDVLPVIDTHLDIICRNAAWGDTRQAEVRSDKYEFDGNTVLSDTWQTQHGAALDQTKLPTNADNVELTSYEQTYKSGIEMDELKQNGQYRTNAVVTYKGDAANIGTPATKTIDLTEINDLNIHTPVACDGVITDGVECQKDENGAEQAVLTLKEALNFFTLCIDNTGTHRMSLGYGNKDFRYALSGKSNVAENDDTLLNQVKFPFDVYVDVGNDSRNADGTYKTTGDYFVEAGSWLTIGEEEKTFYVPVTLKNGTCRIDFRTIAVNCPTYENGEYASETALQELVNSISENYIATDTLEIVIRSFLRDFLITSTTDPHASEKLVEGKQALILKKGYGFTFDLLSQGEFYGETSKVRITPTFFWVSADEKDRDEVLLYLQEYKERETERECYPWKGIPLLEQQKNYEVILQRFTGGVFLPEGILCVAKAQKQKVEEYMSLQTITGKEPFFKQNGYLVVHFDIQVRSEEGIWYTFDHWEDTKIYQEAVAAEWNYIPGDVIRYDLSKSILDDYEIGGLE